MSIDSIRSNFNKYDKAQERPIKQEAFNAFLKTCGQYYAKKYEMRCCLFDDKYYRLAGRVLKREVFPDNPNAFQRMKPSASKYENRLQELCRAFSNEDDSALSEKVDAFVKAHMWFAQCYVKECKTTGKKEMIGADLNNPETMQMMYESMMQFLIANPSCFSKAMEKVELSDESLFFPISFYSILHKIAQESELQEPFSPCQYAEYIASAVWQSCYGILQSLFGAKQEEGEPFSQLNGRMKQLQTAYRGLSEEEKIGLVNVLRKELDESGTEYQPVSEADKFLYKEIYQIVHRPQDKEVLSAIWQKLFRVLQRDWEFAKSMSENSEILNRAQPRSNLEVIHWLSELPGEEYQKIQDHFKQLPDQAYLTPEVTKGKYFYEIENVISLAYSLERNR